MPLSSVVGAQSIVKPGVCTSTNKPASPFDGQVIYMTDVDQTAVWDGTQWTVLAPIAGGRNKIINGGMDVWQRGTSFTTDNAATFIYTADRWVARAHYPNSGAVQVITRESTHVPTGFVYSLKSVIGTAAVVNNARMQIGYTMENIDALKYAGKTLTVSCQIKAIGNINIVYGRANYNTSGGKSIEGTLISQTTLAVNTSSFTTCTFTFTVPSAATLTPTGTLGIYFVYSRSSGTEQVGDGIYLGAVQMEAGAVATPFEFENYGTTLAKCQRYYQKIVAYDARGGAWATTAGYVSKSLPVTMRAEPSSTLPTTGLTNCIDEIGLGSRSVTSFVAFNSTTDRYSFYSANIATLSTATAHIVYMGPTIPLSAEL